MPTIRTTFGALGSKSVTDYCRWLIKADVDPSSRLEVYRHSEEPNLIVKSIGEGAKWTICENAWRGPEFVKYRPFPATTMAFAVTR